MAAMARAGIMLGTAVGCMFVVSCWRDNGFEPNSDPSPRGPHAVGATRTVVLSPSRDTYIKQEFPHRNYGAADSLRVAVYSSYGYGDRTILAFSQTSIDSAIAGDSILSATLEFTKRDAWNAADGRLVLLYRMARDWIEPGATWMCANDLNTANNAADCATTGWSQTGSPSPTTGVSRDDATISDESGTAVVFDVTREVQVFAAGTATNLGWMLRPGGTVAPLGTQASGGGGTISPAWFVTFGSRESATPPRLVLHMAGATPSFGVPDSMAAWVFADTNVSGETPYISGPHLKRVVLVQFHATATEGDREAAIADVGGAVVGGHPIGSGYEGYYYVSVDDDGLGAGVRATADQLDASPHVAGALPAYIVEPMYRKPVDGSGFTDWALSSDLAGGDNWAWERISAPHAWGCETGDGDVGVVVVDHYYVDEPLAGADLQPNLLVRNGVKLAAGAPSGADHGMRTSGVIAAVGNNGIGMAGVMRTGLVSLYSPPIGEFFGSAKVTVDLHAANIVKAAENGGKVINLSLGLKYYATPGQPQLRRYNASNRNDVQRVQDVERVLQRTIDDLELRSYTPLFVIAAGNNNDVIEAAGYPAVRLGPDSGRIIVVGGIEPGGSRWVASAAEGSNLGGGVDLAAPADAIPVFTQNGRAMDGGTSLAAPFVSGVAGLMLSMDPSLSADSLKRLLVAGALAANRPSPPGQFGPSAMPVLDAYQALRLTAAKIGGPLCGNRIWADGNTIRVQRGSTVETFYSAGAPAGALAAHHGGRTIEALISGTGYVRFTYAPGGWSGAVPIDLNVDNVNGIGTAGAAYSVFGLSHDGDSAARVVNGTFRGELGVQIDIWGGPLAVRVLPPLVHPINPDFAWNDSRRKAKFDAEGNFIDWEVTEQRPLGYYTLAGRATFSPLHDSIYVASNAFFHSVVNPDTPWVACSGSVPQNGVNSEECRGFVWVQRSLETKLWGRPLSGTTAWTELSTTAGKTTYWFGFAEDMSEVTMARGAQEGITSLGAPNVPDCAVLFAPWRNTTIAGHSASGAFCAPGLRGAGSFAAVRAPGGTLAGDDSSSAPRQRP